MMHLRSALIIGTCVALTTTGCAFQGLNSLPLPGAIGRGPGAHIYHVKVANVATLESNSPVMLNDVVVGSVGQMTVQENELPDNGGPAWYAMVDVSVQPDVVIPKNAVATIGQTSLLGSMHLALDPPLGEEPQGKLQPGETIELNKSSTYPTTERTLSSLSLVIHAGGLAQFGDIVQEANAALSGRGPQVRVLLQRLDKFIGTLDGQRDNIVASIKALDRLTETFAGQRDVLTEALNKVPPALDVLIKERPKLTEALVKLGTFGDTATQLVHDSKDYLVRNLQNLEPAMRALADVGPDLAASVGYVLFYPYNQDMIDRGARGDYMNLFAVVDLSRERLKRTLLLGTRWGEPGIDLPGAPGEPYYLQQTWDPVGMPSIPADTPPGASAPVEQASGPAAPPAPEPATPPVLVPAEAPAAIAPPDTAETPWPPSEMDMGG